MLGKSKRLGAAKDGTQSSVASLDSERQQIQAEQQRLIDDLTKSKEPSVPPTAFDPQINPGSSAARKPFPQIGVVLVCHADVAESLSTPSLAQPLGENSHAVNVSFQTDMSDNDDIYGDAELTTRPPKVGRKPATLRKTFNRRAWLDFRVSS